MRTVTDVIAAFQHRAGAEAGTAVFRSRRQLMAAMHARDVDCAFTVMNLNMRRIGRVYARLAKAQEAAGG